MTGAISLSLELLLPETTITALPHAHNIKDLDELKNTPNISGLDIWFTASHHVEDLGNKLIQLNIKTKVSAIPSTDFYGFHPDNLNLIELQDGRTIPSRWSTLALWAFKNKIAPKDAKKLFNKKTFKLLGYLDSYVTWVDRLKQSFTSTGFTELDFKNYF